MKWMKFHQEHWGNTEDISAENTWTQVLGTSFPKITM
jgi:hypothetical protein